MKWLLTMLMLVAAMAMPTVASAAITPSKPTSGDGSTSNPYQISTAAQLYWFAGLVNGTLSGVTKNPAACAKLMANITVNSSVLKSDGTINSGKVSGFTAWTPIANYNSTSDNVIYTGTFDGNGKTISGLYIEDADKTHLGLFGTSSGTIKNVGVIDTYFHGNNNIGSICGQNQGTVMSCFGKSYLYGADFNVGGVCGSNTTNATIINCYHIGIIYDWEPNVGGICGYNYGGIISYCYHIGNIEHANKTNSGGVCGNNTGTITKCYYDKDKCSVGGINRADASGQAEGKTTAQFSSGEMAMVLQGSQSGTVWGQTIGTDNNPVIGGPKVNFGYPANSCYRNYTNSSVTELPIHVLDSNGFCSRCGGYQMAEKVSGTHHSELNATHNGYYAIENAGQLYWFASLVDGTLEYMPQNTSANAVLTTNITINSNVIKSDGSLNTDKSSGFRVMPQIKTKYSGTFDGNGKTIGGLYLNDETAIDVSLFAKIAEKGILKNIGIVDSYIKVNIGAAGLCFRNYGLIYKCYNKSTIDVIFGRDYSGGSGICNYNNGRIENCYNAGKINGNNCFSSGLCVINAGVIVNCYNTGEVKGISEIGGLVSINNYYASIANCYSSGSIMNGERSQGSFCGENRGTITNCYYDKDKCSVGGINGSDVAGQAEGKTTAQFQSGEMAYLLAQGCTHEETFYDGSVWGQTIGTDDYPVLGGKKVYYGYTDCQPDIKYSNTPTTDTPTHKYDNGFCTVCKGYQPAEQVSYTHHSELFPDYQDYYAIENAGQLYWFADQVNKSNNLIDVVLTADITVNSGVIDSNGSLASNTSGFRVWTPIGWHKETSSRLYNGIVDGNNHYISGLYHNDESVNSVGLLGYTNGTVRNLGIRESYFKGGDNVGSMCGEMNGNIYNCYFFNGQIQGKQSVGGLCGYGWGSQNVICNSYFAGTVSGTSNVGSVCGKCEQANAIANCYYDKEKCSIGGIGGSDVAGQAEGKTLAQFQSGEVAYLLSQGGTVDDYKYDGSNWGQLLSWTNYPLLGNKKVYYGYDTCDESAEKKYTNKSVTETRPNHSFDTNGFCTVCTSGYQPADLVSNTHHKELVETHNGYYAIENGGQLYWFAKQVNGGQTSKNAVLTANITVNSSVLKSDGTFNSANAGSFTAWTPIGNDPKIYTGTFDGNGNTVSGLYLDNSSKNYMGLFGYSNGTVKNVGVVDSYFKGNDYIGGVCGLNYGKIMLCYSKSYLYSANSAVGGVCGSNNSGSITNSYNAGSVNGTTNVGGVCGYNYASISNCHNIGAVSGTNYVGSVCGQNGKTISNCYYDNVKCSANGINGADVAGQAEGKTTAQFSSGEVAYLLAKGTDGSKWGQLLGTDNYPVPGGAKVYYGYECTQTKYANTPLSETPNHTYDNGFCTICDICQPAQKVSSVHYPELVYTNDGNYAIENAGQLYWFADQVNNYYQTNYTDGAVLVADITVNKGVLNSDGSLSANSSSFRPWHGIGYWTDTQRRVLYGTFDGNGHIISGLYSNDADKDYTGLIGYGQCTIQNVGLVDAYFNGKDYVGSICGYNNWGYILNCYSVSSVAGTSDVGSICGYNNNGTIANCYYDNGKCSTGGVNGADVSGQTVGKTEDKFHNGEVAYLLAHPDNSEASDYEIWGQQLGVDDYPVGSEYKLVPTALKSEDNTYWATFSDQDYDVTLSVPSTRTLNVYNATVSGGTMSLTGRTDNQVATGEGVLLKTDGEYVNVKENDTDELTKVEYTYNNLVATPYKAETITADAGYTLYRLTYNNVSKKEGLGFYLGVVKDDNGNVASSDGSQLKATPGKAYLKVANSEVKTSPSGAAVRAFVFPDNDEDITGIECITVSDDELRGNGNNSVHDLGGRKVSDSSKGVYIKNNRVVFKLKD